MKTNKISLSRSGKTIRINDIEYPNNGVLPVLLKDTGLITFDSNKLTNEEIIQDFLNSVHLIEILEEIKAEKNNAQLQKENKALQMELIGKSIATASANDILKYISYVSILNGWYAAEILIGQNKLSELILNYFNCSFTATPYDDGQIICKGANGKRITLKRSKYPTIATALNLI